MFLVWVVYGVPASFAQENLIPSSITQPSSKEALHALALTRFHFITLKQFHSALFSFEKPTLSEPDAYLLNTALNTFLTSAGRETMLLEALRTNKAIQLRLSLKEHATDASGEETYQMISHPTKPLLYRLEPAVRSTPALIELKPLLDQPAAFQITMTKGNECCRYEVDWSGKITRQV